MQPHAEIREREELRQLIAKLSQTLDSLGQVTPCPAELEDTEELEEKRRVYRPIAWKQFERELLELYAFPSRARGTRGLMKQMLREIGELPGVETTAHFTSARVMAWLGAHRTRAANTLVGQLSYLRAAANFAHKWGYLKRTPFDDRPISGKDGYIRRSKPSIKRHHSLEEIACVLDYLRSMATDWHWARLYVATAIVAYTGVRKREGLHFQWPDLELDEEIGWIRPHHRLKTEDSEAPVCFPALLCSILREWEPRSGSLWVVPRVDREGPWLHGLPGYKPLDRLKQAGDAVGVPGFTFLSLRHSWATHAEAWGVPELLVQRQLRHTRPMTQKAYRHADLPNLTAACSSINFESPFARRRDAGVERPHPSGGTVPWRQGSERFGSRTTARA